MSAGTLENSPANAWLPVIAKVGLPTFLLGVVCFAVWTEGFIPLRDAAIRNYDANTAACRELVAGMASMNDKCNRIETRTERIEFLLTKDPKAWNFSNQP